MGTALQVPGWGNIFTQPIINRIEMLATGVRTPVGGQGLRRRTSTRSSASSQEIAEVVRGVRGASGVVPDQVVGKGYVEIDIDREKAARYGIQVGDIQDVVEVAMGGKPLTMTVEGRRRFPGPGPLRPRLPRPTRSPEADPGRRRGALGRGHGAGRAGHGQADPRRPPARPAPGRSRSRSPRSPTSGSSRGRR